MAESRSVDSQQVLQWLGETDHGLVEIAQIEPNREEVVDGMLILWDVPVFTRDGSLVHVDIFRPKDAVYPLPVIFTLTLRGKHSPKALDILPELGVSESSVSQYCAWKAPDPLAWTQMGYAVIYGDLRGRGTLIDHLDISNGALARAGYDIIEWAAFLPWANSKIAMIGISHAATPQWEIAKLGPPHLSCLIAWESFAEFDLTSSFDGVNSQKKRTRLAAWIREHEKQRLDDEDSRSRRNADFSKIKIPLYIVVGWGDEGMQSPDWLSGWSMASSEQKWLEVHGQKKCRYFIQPSSMRRQKSFLDMYLRGKSTEVEQWPRVRIEVRDRAQHGIWRNELEWPLSRTSYFPKYLNATTGKMDDSLVATSTIAWYESTTSDDSAQFFHEFRGETELTGGMRLRLWVSTEESTDVDIFVRLDKIDRTGTVCPFPALSMVDDGPMAFGWLRVSHREMDPVWSTIEKPVHQYKRELPLRPYEIVPIDVEIFTSSTVFEQGDQLRLTIQGNNPFVDTALNRTRLPKESRNKGKHFIHTGGPFDSYLLLPVVVAKTVDLLD